MITRRKLVLALGASALAPLASFAQPAGKIWRVGFLAYGHVDFVDADYMYGPFTQGLRDLGYEPVGSSPREFAAYIKAEIAKWAKVIAAGKIKAE